MIEGLSTNLPILDTTFSATDMEGSGGPLQVANRQTLKNQKDKMAQKEKLNETLLSILCETIESTFCNILHASSIRLKKQNEQFEERMDRIRSG